MSPTTPFQSEGIYRALLSRTFFFIKHLIFFLLWMMMTGLKCEMSILRPIIFQSGLLLLEYPMHT